MTPPRFLEGQSLGASQLNRLAAEVARRSQVSLQPPFFGTDSPVTGLALSYDAGQFWAKVRAQVPAPSTNEFGYLFVDEVVADEHGTWVQTAGGRAGKAYPVDPLAQVAPGTVGLILKGAADEWRFLTTGGGGGGTVVVRANAANDGTQWTSGSVVRTGDLPNGAASGTEVQVQPRYGAGVTSGGVYWAGHRLRQGLDYLVAYDSGTTGGTPPKRRLYVMPIGLTTCDASGKIVTL